MQRRFTRKQDTMAPKSTRRNPARLARAIQNELGRNLRAMYNDVVEQGVPDRFADLLAKLEPSGKGDDKPAKEK
jgi:hypothetical protein